VSRFFRGRPRKRQASDPADAAAADLALTVLLARREHASAEARQKLLDQGYDAAVVEQVLAEFTERHLLDDSRFAEHYVAAHAGRGQGPVRIRHALADLGLAADVIEQSLAEGPDFRKLCRQLRQRRFGDELPPDWTEKAKQVRFLQYRGFSLDHIRSALGPDIELE
jgi:regulatory protein